MKLFLPELNRGLGLALLAAGLSSCSLFQNGKYASQWEIETDVPASLNSGQASSQTPREVAGGGVHSDLSGQETNGLPDMGGLDSVLPGGGMIADVPKPDQLARHEVSQSPPELLNAPVAVAAVHDLPSPSGAATGQGLTMLLPAPPPAVVEEELPAAGDSGAGLAGVSALSTDSGPVSLTSAAVESAPEPLLSVGEIVPAGDTAPAAPVMAAADTAAVPAPSLTIPLLYGKLDLTPFLSPASLVAKSPAPPSGDQAVPASAAP